MSTVNLVEETFSETVHGNDTVLIDFWAQWCGPCRMFGPVYERVSEDFPEIVFGKVDTDAEQGLAAGFRISSIPTLMAIRDGVVLYSQPGAIGEPQLRQLIAAVLEIDMDAVHAELAEQRSSTADAEATG